jgi:uncharacterized LabA/DUF88 family protein
MAFLDKLLHVSYTLKELSGAQEGYLMAGFISGGSAIKEIEYLFIDGGYLRTVYTNNLRKFFGEVIGNPIWHLDFNALKRNLGAQKAFYYDCSDGQKEMEEFLRRVRSAGGYHVVLGELKGERRQRQKEVDVHLAVDALRHAAYRNISTAIIIAGDQDLRPAIQALVDLGIYVKLFYERDSASPELVEAADSRNPITLNTLYGWSTESFRAMYQIPQACWNAQRPREGCELLRRGIITKKEGPTDVEISLYKDLSREEFVIFVERYWNGQSLEVRSGLEEDLEKLEKYFVMEFGEIKWLS